MNWIRNIGQKVEPGHYWIVYNGKVLINTVHKLDSLSSFITHYQLVSVPAPTLPLFIDRKTGKVVDDETEDTVTNWSDLVGLPVYRVIDEDTVRYVGDVCEINENTVTCTNSCTYHSDALVALDLNTAMEIARN